MTLCQHIIKGASSAALMLTSPLGHAGNTLQQLEDKKKKKQKKMLLEKLAVFLSRLCSRHNECNMLIFVMGSEFAVNLCFALPFILQMLIKTERGEREKVSGGQQEIWLLLPSSHLFVIR